MQHVVVTIEEQLILKAIKDECQWENLPKRLQATLTSKEEWHRRIIEYCIKKRLQWSNCFACKVCKESEYYEDMMRYLRRNLAVNHEVVGLKFEERRDPIHPGDSLRYKFSRTTPKVTS